MSGYIGNIPVPQATQTRQTFTATASQTTFNTAGYSPGYIDVFLNGVKLAPADYTATNGSDVVLAVGAASGDILETVAYEIFQVLDQDFTGDFTVDGSTFVVDSTNDRVGIGIASPASKLHIDESAAAGTGILLTNDNNISGTYSDIKWQYSPSDPSYGSGIRFKQLDTTHGGQLEFFTDNTTGTYTQRMTITEDGNVGIGTSSPDIKFHVSGGNARIAGTEASGSFIDINASNTGSDGATLGVSYYGSGSYGPLKFSVGGSERMRIDSSGNVGIGTSSPKSFSGQTHVTVNHPSGGTNVSGYSLRVADTEYSSLITYPSNSEGLRIATVTALPMTFQTNNSERMRLDSSGHLLFAKTSTSSGVAGIRFAGDAPGYAEFTRDGGNPLFLNRETSNGYIIRFAKDNSYVGSIGVGGSNDLTIGDGPAGLIMDGDGATPLIGPWNTSTNSTSDASVDLGYASGRFKDLYLSGGVYLGGTGSANHLDDYEEGTWVPAPRGASVAGSVTGLNFYGIYTKIGRQVTVNFDCDYSALSGASGNLEIHGLPYTVLAGSEAVGAIMLDGMNFNSSLYTQLTLYAAGSTTKMLIFMTGDDIGWAVQGVVNEQIGIRGTITYMTA